MLVCSVRGPGRRSHGASARTDDVPRVVPDLEHVVTQRGLAVAPRGRSEEDRRKVRLVHRRDKLCVRGLRRDALRVEEAEDARGRAADHVDAPRVVHELRAARCARLRHAFLDIQPRLRLEDPLDEELLQPLICEIDAQLLEAVRLEVLEAEDVEHPDERQLGRCAPVGRVRAAEAAVDRAHDPDEDELVQRASERVARARALRGSERNHELLVHARHGEAPLEQQWRNVDHP